MISALLPSLPGKLRSKIISMVRPVTRVVDSPWAVLARLAEFLGEAFTNGPAVAACVKPALHRQR